MGNHHSPVSSTSSAKPNSRPFMLQRSDSAGASTPSTVSFAPAMHEPGQRAVPGQPDLDRGARSVGRERSLLDDAIGDHDDLLVLGRRGRPDIFVIVSTL